MKLVKLNQKDEKIQSFKNNLILEVKMDDYIPLDQKIIECNRINEKFLEEEYITLLDKNDNILMATYIVGNDFINDRDALILNDFDGIFVELIYSLHDISFDEKGKQVNSFLKLLSKEYPNILLYSENITGGRFYKKLKSYPSIFDKTELISFNADYSISKHSNFSIEDKIKSVQSNGPIKHILTRYVDMNVSIDSVYFRNLINEQLKVYNKKQYNQIEGLEMAIYSDVYNYMKEKKQYILAIATFENGKEVLVGLLTFINKEINDVKYILLDYVNSHKGYRKKGIAKLLYSSFNNHLNELNKNEKVILVSSKITESGAEANLNKIRNELIEGIEMYDNLNQFKKKKKIK